MLNNVSVSILNMSIDRGYFVKVVEIRKLDGGGMEKGWYKVGNIHQILSMDKFSEWDDNQQRKWKLEV